MRGMHLFPPLSHNHPTGGVCGFHDANSLSRLFSKRLGISMRDYGAQNRAR